MTAAFDDPKYSVWLILDRKLSEQFDPLIEELTTAIHKHHNLRERKDTREVTRKALSVILANLVKPPVYVPLRCRVSGTGGRIPSAWSASVIAVANSAR